MVLFCVLGKKILILSPDTNSPAISAVRSSPREAALTITSCYMQVIRWTPEMYLISNHFQYHCRSQTLQMWLQQLLNGNRMPSIHLKDCKIIFWRNAVILSWNTRACLVSPLQKSWQNISYCPGVYLKLCSKDASNGSYERKTFSGLFPMFCGNDAICFPWLLFSYSASKTWWKLFCDLQQNPQN